MPRGEVLYLSLESVGELSATLDLKHEPSSCWILWDLGLPYKTPGQRNHWLPLLFPLFSLWTYNICAPKSDNSSSKTFSHYKLCLRHHVRSCMHVMSLTLRTSAPHMLCAQAPCSCPNPSPNETAFDSHLMTFWSYPQQTSALIKEELIHTRPTSSVYVHVCVFVRIHGTMNLRATLTQLVCHPNPG